jgi:tetratricopeptide (TPR) repeat protein
MPPVDEAVPQSLEIERQLARMLASPVFTEAPAQAKLLEYLVKCALDGKEVTEKTILSDLFPSYLVVPSHQRVSYGGRKPPERNPSGIARVFKQELIKRLYEYYEDDGAGDLVIIHLESHPRKKGYRPPPGKAYRPIFRYNPASHIDREYRRGLFHLDQCTPADDSIALDCFSAVLHEKSDHVYAHVRKAEVYLRRSIYHQIDFKPLRSLEKAEESITRALQETGQMWRAHAIQGTLHCFRRRWKDAQSSFDRALALDSLQTCYGAWYYPSFLAATGRLGEALDLTQERARIYPDDLPAQILHGIFLYISRRFDEALLALSAAQVMNPRHWLTCVISALLAIAQNEPAAAHVILVHHLLGTDAFPGLAALSLSLTLRLRKSPEQWGPGRRNASGSPLEQVYFALDELIDRLPQPPQYLAQLLEISKQKYVSALQLALAYLAVDDFQHSVLSLKQACDEPNPVTSWLPSLPLFDALCQQKEFHELLASIKSSESSTNYPPSV